MIAQQMAISEEIKINSLFMHNDVFIFSFVCIYLTYCYIVTCMFRLMKIISYMRWFQVGSFTNNLVCEVAPSWKFQKLNSLTNMYMHFVKLSEQCKLFQPHLYLFSAFFKVNKFQIIRH